MAPRNGAGAPEAMSALAIRVHGEYREMPGLRLTVRQAARLFSLTPDLADAVLDELRRASILTCSNDEGFALVGESRAGPPFNAPPASMAVSSQHGTSSGQWPAEPRIGFETDGAPQRGSHDTVQHRHS